MNLICLVCGWRGSEDDRRKTYTEQTVAGHHVDANDDIKYHFYEMGFRSYWECRPVVADEGQAVSHAVCDSSIYQMRQRYYDAHEAVYKPDDEIRRILIAEGYGENDLFWRKRTKKED